MSYHRISPPPADEEEQMSSNDETESVDAWSPKIKKRWRFTPEDLTVLETSFMTESQHPKQRTVERLAMQLGSPRRTITTWFQNRRAKEKKKHAKKNELPASSAAASHIGQPLLEDQLWPVCTDPNCIYCSYFYYCYKYTNAQQ